MPIHASAHFNLLGPRLGGINSGIPYTPFSLGLGLGLRLGLGIRIRD